MRREALLTGTGERAPVVVADVLATIRQVEPTVAQLDVARSALATAPGGQEGLTCARVDLIPGPHGPVLLELEATDRFPFLAHATSEARARTAEHLLARTWSGRAVLEDAPADGATSAMTPTSRSDPADDRDADEVRTGRGSQEPSSPVR